MVLNRFRAIAEKLSERPVNFFAKHNVTPNRLSIIGFILTVPPAFFLWKQWLSIPVLNWTVPVFIFIAGAFDAFDGSVARKMNLVTKYGGFLDSMLDRFSDAIMVIGLTTGGYFNWQDPNNLPFDTTIGVYVGFWALVSILLISYIRSAAEKGGVNMKGVGFMERGERILIFFGGAIAYFWVQFGYGGGDVGKPAANFFFFWFLIVFTVMMNFTIVERVVFAIRNLRRIDREMPLLTKMPEKKGNAPHQKDERHVEEPPIKTGDKELEEERSEDEDPREIAD